VVVPQTFCCTPAERWATAAKAAEMIYLSSHFTVRGVPADFVWRLLEFVAYVLPLLVQLIEKPGLLSIMHAMQIYVE
jgi:hypothetical protein